MRYKINGEYLQVWNGERCVSLGTAEKLVRNIMSEDQTKKIRSKLTNLSEKK